MKHQKLFISLTAVFSVLLILAIFLMIWFWGDSYKSGKGYTGFEDFSSEIEIPGLKDGACPQGIGNYRANYTVKDENGEPKLDESGKEIKKTQEYFFISAYMKSGEASRIYVVGKDTGYVGYVTLENKDGSIYSGHCGGVATNGFNLWVVSDGTVFVASKENDSGTNNIAYDIIKGAETNEAIRFTASFNANCRGSFCFFYDADGGKSNSYRSSSDRLYVGEFYREKNYKTDERHHITSSDESAHHAFMYEYYVSSSVNDYGLQLISADNVAEADRVPRVQKVFSIPDQIQGFARVKNGVVLSQSYGLKNSHLLFYNWEDMTSTTTSVSHRKLYKDLTFIDEDDKEQKYEGFTYDGVYTTTSMGNQGALYRDTSSSLYVYYADGNFLENDYSIPSMSEGMCVVTDPITENERVCVLFESGAKKYRAFVRQILDHVYSFVPKKK